MAYAPIEYTDEEDKDDFSTALLMTVDDVPRHHVQLLLGDLKAKVQQQDKERDKRLYNQVLYGSEACCLIAKISVWE